MGVKPYEAGSRAGGGLTGMMLLKSSSKLKIWKATYGKGTTLIRVWGNTYVDDTGVIKMVPHRDNDGYFGTSFFVQDAVCDAWGKDSRFTFMTRVEDEENWPAGSPADVFYTEVHGHPDFKWLTERPSATDFAPMSAPTVNGFIKGLLLECGGKDHKGNPIWGTVLRLTKSAKEAFEQLLDTENPTPGEMKDPEDPNGWNSKYLVGDPIGFKTGKIFEFNKESKFLAKETAEINLQARGGDGSKSSGGGAAIESYACRLWPNKPILELPATRVHSANETFEDALRYMTGVEQINQVLIPAFGRSCKESLLYVFGGKDLLPAAFEFGRTTHDMAPKEPATRTSTAAKTAAAETASEPAEPEINLDGEYTGSDDNDEPPFTPDPSAPLEEAPVVTTTAAAPAQSSADELKARLAAARAKK